VKDYAGSFFFWMDTIGAVSCLADFTFVENYMYSNSSGSSANIRQYSRLAKLAAR